MLKFLFYFSLVAIPIVTFVLQNSNSYRSIGYLGVIICLVLSAMGTTKGMSSISKYVSGLCIGTPRVSNKSIYGSLMCEAGLLISLLHCIAMSFLIVKMKDTIIHNSLLFCSGVIVGTGFYFSSIAVGVVCGAVSLVDAKHSEMFFKLVVLEFLPASVGLLGFILGTVINEKVKKL